MSDRRFLGFVDMIHTLRRESRIIRRRLRGLEIEATALLLQNPIPLERVQFLRNEIEKCQKAMSNNEKSLRDSTTET